MPPAAVPVQPAREASNGFCSQACVGRVSQDLVSSKGLIRSESLGLTWTGKQLQFMAVGCIEAQARAVVCTQVVSL